MNATAPVATRMKDVAVSTKDMYMVDPRTIKVQKDWNRRDFQDPANIAHVETLAQSIATVGLLNPIIVRFQEGSVVLADGECRLRATLLAIERGADIPAVQVVPEVRGMGEDLRLLAQGTRNMGKQMSDLEWASIIAGMMQLGWNEERIAQAVGRSVSWVEAKLTLAEAPKAVKDAVMEGSIAAGTVIKAIAKDGVTKGAAKITEAVEAAKTVVVADSKVTGASKVVSKPRAPRVTSNQLEERGGAAPTRTYRREEIRNVIEAMKKINEYAKGDDPAFAVKQILSISSNVLENLGFEV